MINDAPKCIIKPSSIEGQGLFAAQDFKVGEIVVDYSQAWHFTIKDFSELTNEEVQKCKWIGINEEKCLVPFMDMKFFLVNHSNSPNCLWVREKQILVALKNISKDEEITYDYNLDVKPKNWSKPSWAK